MLVKNMKNMLLAALLIKLLTTATLLAIKFNLCHATGLSPIADMQNEREILRNLMMSKKATSTPKPLENPQETTVTVGSFAIATFSTETSVAVTLQSTLDHTTTATLTTHSDNHISNDDSPGHNFNYILIIITIVVIGALVTIVTVVIYKFKHGTKMKCNNLDGDICRKRREEKIECKVYVANENCNTIVSVS